MSAQLLDYVVKNISCKVINGGFDKIYQKNNDGFQVITDDGVTITLELKVSCLISSIQIKMVNVSKCIIKILSQSEQQIEEQTKMISQIQKIYLVNFNNKREAKYIKLMFFGLHSNYLSVKYVIVKGQKKINKNVSNNKNKKQRFFQQPKKSPHSITLKTNTNSVFEGRVKHKQKEKQGKRIEEQDQVLNKVLQMSKKQAEKNKFSSNKSKLLILEEENTLLVESQQAKHYNKTDYNTHKHIFTYVNSKWLQAQKKAQSEFGVKEEQKLSLRIKIKHLFNKEILIDLAHTKKSQLERMANEMGAKIISQLKNDTERVSRARKLGSVAIVSPEFIEQCNQCDALLNIKDYYIKL